MKSIFFTHETRHNSGNVLIMILIAIALMGALTTVVSSGLSGSKGTKDNTLKTKATQVMRFSNSVKDAVTLIYSNGASESDISFGSPVLTGYGNADVDAPNEVFNDLGGGAKLMNIPEGISASSSQWEFYGFSRAPDVGVDAEADLMLVLPDVTLGFCQAINQTLGYDANATPPVDTSADAKCVHDTATRFTGTFATGGAINDMDKSNFDVTPASYGCVRCATTSAYHYYYTLLER